ncbi:MAG TPA: hypothetical protein VMB48_13270 [Steroidobacteraceae bacterium]|nr:hypothetical protein [Steroidobacteraceae bacterium]
MIGLLGGTLAAVPGAAAPHDADRNAAAGGQVAATAGHIDVMKLTGTWERYGGAKLDPRFTAAAPVPPPPLKQPYLAQWQARQQAAHEADLRGQPPFGGYAHCLPDGMPAMMMAMFPMEVLQTPGQITIIEEAYNQVRRIYLDEKQLAVDDAEPGFWGHSVGRWDGASDTLIVNTVGIKEEVRFRDAPHSARMQIDERIRLLSNDLFEDRVTVTDPVYLSGPWRFTWRYVRKPGYKILEYVCEDNHEYEDPRTGAIRMRIGDPGAASGGSAPPGADRNAAAAGSAPAGSAPASPRP